MPASKFTFHFDIESYQGVFFALLDKRLHRFAVHIHRCHDSPVGCGPCLPITAAWPVSAAQLETMPAIDPSTANGLSRR